MKHILIECGYDNIYSLKLINDDKLNALEMEMNTHPQVIQSFNCTHSKVYKSQPKFKILLGHRTLLLHWIQNLSQTENQSSERSIDIDHPALSKIMSEILRCFLANHNKPPNNRRFSELVMNYSIYLYILAGKACYEIICENLPLPKVSTISMFAITLFE